MPRRLLAIALAVTVTASVLVATALADPPSLDPPAQGNITAEATGPGGASVSWSPVTATDPEDGTIVLSCAPGPGLFPLGTTGVSCSGSDAEGNPITHGFSVTVEDTTGPALGDVPGDMTVTAGETVTYATPTATDLVDGARPVSCDPASGFTATVALTVSCSASDLSGNVSSANFLVTVTAPPNAPPTLILPGNITVEATGSTTSVSFTASASDPEDDPDPTPTCDPASGFAFPVGTTTVGCSVTDGGGASDSGSFTVAVEDTTPPVVTAPGNMTVAATGANGAIVAFGAATASDLVDGALAPSCSPASGSLFPLATTTVTCSATDTAGNTGSAAFSVTVQDAGAPVVSVPENTTVEATGPSGATVTYRTVTAIDDVDGTIPNVTCSKASGTVFGLGRTAVTCQATDSSGKTGSATFYVSVEDRTPPVVAPPADIAVKATAPVAATDPAIAAFLAGAGATDLVDTSPGLVVDAPATFELGFTTVTFTATDASGNIATATAKVEVGPNPLQPQAIDRVPPGNVKKLAALAGDRSYLFRWSNPGAGDFTHVEVIRSPGKAGAADTVVYKGKKASFRDKGLTDGGQYRYLFVSYDESGNRSVGVAIVVLARTQLLLTPPNGATLTRPPKLTWKKTSGVKLHNLQLFYAGGASARTPAAGSYRKVLSVFPTGTSYTLRSSWTFEGKRRTLAKGCYVWYVWPYLASGKYGELLGQSEFCYRPKGKKS